jgi:hypothetical protein
MRHKERSADASVTVGDQSVLIERKNRSEPVVARLLGREVRGEMEVLYLDRLIHEPWEDSLGSWNVSGAVSTIMSRVFLVSNGADDGQGAGDRSRAGFACRSSTSP